MNEVKRVAVVTGGANGIGLATVLLLNKLNYNVICLDVNKNALNKLNEYNITNYYCDVSDFKQCQRIINKIYNKYQHIHILFNNCGIQPHDSNQPIHMLKEEYWDLIINVNLKSIYNCCHLIIPYMIQQNYGVIINNASIQGIQSQTCVPAYAASKGGVISLTRQLAVDYGQYNIRVNSIAPGTIITDIGIRNTDISVPLANTPLKRTHKTNDNNSNSNILLGVPKDVANVVSFLCDDKSSWISGQNIIIDGGITIKGGWSKL